MKVTSPILFEVPLLSSSPVPVTGFFTFGTKVANVLGSGCSPRTTGTILTRSSVSFVTAAVRPGLGDCTMSPANTTNTFRAPLRGSDLNNSEARVRPASTLSPSSSHCRRSSSWLTSTALESSENLPLVTALGFLPYWMTLYFVSALVPESSIFLMMSFSLSKTSFALLPFEPITNTMSSKFFAFPGKIMKWKKVDYVIMVVVILVAMVAVMMVVMMAW